MEVRIEDDASDRLLVGDRLRALAADCDLLLGPYSSDLMRAAAKILLGSDRLLWNHGGAASDVQAASPG